MTCVWNGLIQKLGLKMSPNQLCDRVKAENIKTESMRWNGMTLSEIQYAENIERIKNIDNIEYGYDCSAFDPLMFLVGELFKKSIIHYFNGVKIEYTNCNYPSETIVCHSDRTHFW